MANGVAVFDIFSLSEKFEKVGFPKDHAKVIIEAIVSSRSNPEAVSHAELEAKTVKIEANAEKHESKVLNAIAAMEARFDSKFEILKRDMTIRLGGMVVLGSGLVVTILRYLLIPELSH